MKKNTDIRETAVLADVKLWQIADRYGLSDGNFSRLLRRELTAETKNKIFAIIEEIKADRPSTNGCR